MEFLSLERHFSNVCNSHPHLKLLESQWQFDKELIGKALQNVSAVFPHYSRHDASHSRQIIVNIERMLGNKIQHLTATDAWLILESAYNHDIGMVITHRQIEDLDTPDFKRFLKDISEDKGNPLREFAKKWDSDKATLPSGSTSKNFLNNYTQIIAEWYRRKHPENSAKIVNNPLFEIGLDSPRNELLPKRLFGMLAEICRMHGQDFDEVLNLPFAEAGMATEDCHPRYVACLLRMADLLDIDSDRFCPVMMNVYGQNLPSTSRAHVEKHHSVKAFRLDTDRIEILAECPTPDSYQAAFDWFKWLETEHHRQTQNWYRICPNKKLGTLPILTRPQVSISLPYIILEQGKKPDLTVDREALLQLVRGTGLYESKFESIREILQNAVDSSLIAAWNEHKSAIINLTPTQHELEKILENFTIHIECKPKDNEKDILTLRVSDQGTGINLDSLKYMLNVGSSSKNKNKRDIIDTMPTWYKPSGNFGIGLQSCYLITKKFRMTTKSRQTGEALSITFFKNSKKSVVIKKLRAGDVNFGTVLEMDIKIEPFPKSMNMIEGHVRAEFQDRLSEYDFTDNESTLGFYEHLKILSEISKFSEHSPVPIDFDGTKVSTDLASNRYDQELITILSNVSFHNSNSMPKMFFRGQPFESKIYVKFAHMDIDFYGYSAQDTLTYNRGSALPEKRPELSEVTIQSVLRYIDERFDSLHIDEQPNAAAFYIYYSNKPASEKHLAHLERMQLTFHDGNSYSMGALAKKIIDKSIPYILQHNAQTKYSKEFMLNSSNESWQPLISQILKKQGYYCQKSKNPEAFRSEGQFKWDKLEKPFLDAPTLKDFFDYQKSAFAGVGSRIIFPSWGKFSDLAMLNVPMWSIVAHYDDINTKYFVLPLKLDRSTGSVTYDTSDKFIEWTYENRKDKDIQFSNFKELYYEVSAFLRSYLTANDSQWSVADGDPEEVKQ